jgi:thiaminase
MSPIRKFWVNGGEIKVVITIISFITGFVLAYTHSIIWGVNLCRDMKDLKEFRSETGPLLEAMQENIVRMCERLGIEPVHPQQFERGRQ